MELFRPINRGACPGNEVLLDGLGWDVLDITFRAHLPKGVCESCQSILPRGDGAFPAIQLPLSGKELLLQLTNYHRHGHHV
jgi:hypothetical protein